MTWCVLVVLVLKSMVIWEITHDFRNHGTTLTPEIHENPTAASGSTPSYRYMRVGQAQTGSPDLGWDPKITEDNYYHLVI